MGRNAKEDIESLELTSNDLLEWFSNNKSESAKKKCSSSAQVLEVFH